MKQVLLPDHIPMNNFDLVVPGGPPKLQFITIDGIDEELETVDLPDRTKASGGNTKAFEFNATHPIHHIVEDQFLESWYLEGKLVSPLYKKACTLIVKSISGSIVRTYNVLGCFPKRRKISDLDMANEGEMQVKEWTFAGDLLIPV